MWGCILRKDLRAASTAVALRPLTAVPGVTAFPIRSGGDSRRGLDFPGGSIIDQPKNIWSSPESVGTANIRPELAPGRPRRPFKINSLTVHVLPQEKVTQIQGPECFSEPLRFGAIYKVLFQLKVANTVQGRSRDIRHENCAAVLGTRIRDARR